MTRSAYENFANKIIQQLGRLVGSDASLFFFLKDKPPAPASTKRICCKYQPFFTFRFPSKTKNQNYSYYVGISRVVEKGLSILADKLVWLTATYLQDLWDGRYDNVDLDSDGDVDIVCSVILRQFVEWFADMTGIDLFSLNELSLRNYESQKCRGTLLFLEDGDPVPVSIYIAQDTKTEKNIYFCSDNLRLIRKLMAGGDGYALTFRRPFNLSHSAEYKLEGYSESYSHGWIINITHPGVFTVSLNGKELFRMNHLCPQIIQNQWERQLQTIIEAFQVKKESQVYNDLSLLLKKIDVNQRGAAVLFLNLREGSKALEHINKLCSLQRGYSVNGKPSVVQAFMDGAIVVNVLNAKITHVGVIVDGIASECGDVSRGARHNSLATFCSYFHDCYPTEPVAAVVFSEDGGSTLYIHEAS